MGKRRDILQRISELRRQGLLNATQTVAALSAVREANRTGAQANLEELGITDEVLWGEKPADTTAKPAEPTIYDETFQFIIGYKKENDGNSPSFRTIMDHFGLKSTSAVSGRIEALINDGRLRRKLGDRQFNAIEVVGGRWEYGGGS